jgi:serine protease Do
MKNNSDRFWKATTVVLIIVLIGAVLYMGSVMQSIKAATGTSTVKALNAGYNNAAGQPKEDPYWVADLVQKALPFVVNVRTESKPKTETPSQNGGGQYKELPNGGGQQDPYQWFQEQFPGMEMPNMPGYEYQQPAMEGVGSGFIVSASGHVVTNAHVVEGMDTFTVTLNDGKEYKAKLIAADKLKDIAILKIDASGLTVAPLGDSTIVRIGEPTIAIGSPFGLVATVTEGIISTTARDPKDLRMPTDQRRVHKLLQTDAAINQGNSGGPLLNAKGEVIGINQAIIPYANGIGFAIPISEVKNTIDQIIKTGKAVYPGIGLGVRDVTPENHGDLKVEVTEGAYVAQVNADGPGDRAGIQPGDVILELNGTKVKTGDGLIALIQQYAVGTRVTALVARGGHKAKISKVAVILGELDQNEFRAGE